MAPSPEAEVSIAKLNEHFVWHPSPGLATTVVYTNDGSPELVLHEALAVVR